MLLPLITSPVYCLITSSTNLLWPKVCFDGSSQPIVVLFAVGIKLFKLMWIILRCIHVCILYLNISQLIQELFNKFILNLHHSRLSNKLHQYLYIVYKSKQL